MGVIIEDVMGRIHMLTFCRDAPYSCLTCGGEGVHFGGYGWRYNFFAKSGGKLSAH
jgi:hypothetical protein